MSASILVIEDDPSIVLGLRINLQRAGYKVRTATGGRRGMVELLTDKPDLLILDLMLPGMNGLEILRELRKTDKTLPVLILTAMGSDTDKVRGLDFGANDYVTKPFSIAELLARVRASLRTATLQQNGKPHDILRAGAIELDRERHSVSLDGVELDLTAREYRFLLFFMERPERVFTREQILSSVWGFDYGGTDRTVDNFVSILRRKLKEDAEHPRHLMTVWGIGYRFVP